MAQLSALARNPRYTKIMQVYHDQFIANGGRVNETKFYKEHIAPIVPGFSYQSWAAWIARFRKRTGMVASLAVQHASAAPVATIEGKLERAMMTNDAATALGIRAALNIGAKALEELLSDPVALTALTPSERANLLFKAMKSQDSRIQAIGKMKEDGREQAKFDRAFDGTF